MKPLRKERFYEGQEILAQMSDEALVALYNRLEYRTKKRFGWFKKLDSQEVVHQTIFEVYTNLRPYPPLDKNGNRKIISLDAFLFGVIRRKVRSDYEKECKRVLFNEEDESLTLAEWFDLLRYKEAQRSGVDMSTPETDAMYRESCDRLQARVSKRKVLSTIVKLLIETPDLRPREIAEKLNMPRGDVHNALRRLDRLVNPRKEGKQWQS